MKNYKELLESAGLSDVPDTVIDVGLYLPRKDSEQG